LRGGIGAFDSFDLWPNPDFGEWEKDESLSALAVERGFLDRLGVFNG
jgi:hypothetical protein